MQSPQACYVVLHIGLGPSDAEEKSGSSLVVTDADRRFPLSGEIWIEKLDTQVAKHIQTACEPADYKIDHFGTDRHLYAFVRRVPDAEENRHEGMEELRAVIALSRIIDRKSVV